MYIRLLTKSDPLDTPTARRISGIVLIVNKQYDFWNRFYANFERKSDHFWLLAIKVELRKKRTSNAISAGNDRISMLNSALESSIKYTMGFVSQILFLRFPSLIFSTANMAAFGAFFKSGRILDQMKYVWYLSPKIAEILMKFQSTSDIFMQEHRYSLTTTNAQLFRTWIRSITGRNGRSNMMICLSE